MRCVCVLTFLLWSALAAVAQPFNADVVYFRYERGAAVPAAQTVTLSEDDHRSLQLLSTVGTWLKPAVLNDPGPGKLRLAVDPTGLTPGIYEGNVLLLAGEDLVSERAQLTVVDPPVFLVDPKTVSLTYTNGDPVPGPVTVYVSAYNQPVRFTATSNSKWLLVTPGSGATPANLKISIDPMALVAGDYTGTITLQSDRISAAIAVTLSVKNAGPQVPTFTAADVLNQASWATGPVSPGELIIVRNVKNGSTQVSRPAGGSEFAPTVLGETRLLFDGIPAPILYVADQEIRAIVPFEVDGKASVQVQAEYQGGMGPAITLQVAPAAPGIWTTNMDGKGQAVAARFNPGEPIPQRQNLPSSPVQRGSGILQFFFTGGGQLVPAGVNGHLSSNSGTLRAPVRVTIGGKQADILYAGQAPGGVVGISQVNARVASDTPTGDAISLQITVAGSTSPNQVTVAVKE